MSPRDQRQPILGRRITSIIKRFVRLISRKLGPKLGVLTQHAPHELHAPAALRPDYSGAAPPTISIVIPSFNQAKFIERTLQSVLAQAYPALEIYVQDGGSSDGTVDIIRRYSGQLTGWDSRPDDGQGEAINIGFAKTSGEIMAWLNSDDILLPSALVFVAEYFIRHPETDVVYGNRILIDENDQEIGRWILPSHDRSILSWEDFIPQETVFWRRSIWERVGAQVDESFRFAMDWDLLLRFREAGARFVHLSRFLGGFRIHARQKTSAEISSVGFQEMDRIRLRVLGRIPSRAEIRRAVRIFMLKHIVLDLWWRIGKGLRFK